MLMADFSGLDHLEDIVNKVYDDEENTTWEYDGSIPWEACKIFNSSMAEDFKLYENLFT